jgi:hypothetical protein
MDLVHQTSNHGLTQSIGEEFNLADPPHRKRIRDNVANAQDWWQAANDDQIKDQAYAAKFSKAARWARDFGDDNDYSNFGTVMTTASKFDVQPMELNNYLNGATEGRDGFVTNMNNRIMPWAPGTPLAQLPEPNANSHGVPNGDLFNDEAEPAAEYKQFASNQHPPTMADATASTGTNRKGNSTALKSGAANPASTYHVPKSVNESQIKVYTDAMLAEMDGEMDAFEWRNTADGKGLKLVTAMGKTAERLDKERGETKIKPYTRTFEQAQNLGWEKLNPYVAPTQEEMDHVYSVIETHFPSKGFMKRIAVQESDEGANKKTARPLYYGGAFQVDEETFRETQIQGGIKDQRDRVSKIIQRDWNTVTWRELRDNPLLSGLAARLSLMRFKKAIPEDLEGQAELWKKKYNTSKGQGSAAEFIKKNQGSYNPSHLGM